MPDVLVAVDVNHIDVDRAPYIKRLIVAAAIERMRDVPRVVHMQMMRVPADDEGVRHAPKDASVEYMVSRIGIVVDGIGPRVIADRCRIMVHDDVLRLVVGDVDHLWVRRDNADRAVGVVHDLSVVGREIACLARLAAESLNGVEHVCLLR